MLAQIDQKSNLKSNKNKKVGPDGIRTQDLLHVDLTLDLMLTPHPPHPSSSSTHTDLTLIDRCNWLDDCNTSSLSANPQYYLSAER